MRVAWLGETSGMKLNHFLFPTTLLLLTTSCAAPGNRTAPNPALADSPVQPTALAAVQQQPQDAPPRAYLRLNGGLSVLPSTNLDSSDAGALQQAEASFDPGFGYNFAGGYRITDDWAVELEIGYRTNPVDEVRSTGPTITDGDFSSLGFFANGIYRVPVEGRLRPYVGLGLGLIEEIDIDIGSGSDVDYSDSAVAIQAIAGLDYALSSRWSLQLEGRYMQSFGQDLAAESGSGISYEADYQPLSLLLGVSWSF